MGERRVEATAVGARLDKRMLSGKDVLALTRERESSAANTFRISRSPPVFTSGEGAWLVSETGEKYLDLVCGSATSNLGHGHPAHRDAIERVLATGIIHTGTRLPSPFRAELYQELASILPERLSCIQLANSGAEAVEAAIKAAQFTTGRKRIIAFEGGYHGRTLGALSVTHGDRIRSPFSTLDHVVTFAPYPEERRSASANSDDGSSLEKLESSFSRLSRKGDPPAAVIVEPVQGVGGVMTLDSEFLTGLGALCRDRGVLFIVDEIWSGFGRCGRWFSFQDARIEPDLVVMGKGLSGGLPLSAVAGSPEILKAWPPGMHTSTFQGNPLSCAMAVATIRTIRDEKLLERVARIIAPMFRKRLRSLPGCVGVSDVRIVGAQAAVELADSRDRPDSNRVRELQLACLGERMLVYAGGRHGNCLMLAPPLIISHADLEAGLDRIVELIRRDSRLQETVSIRNPSGQSRL